jgi:hypothetical protein
VKQDVLFYKKQVLLCLASRVFRRIGQRIVYRLYQRRDEQPD